MQIDFEEMTGESLEDAVYTRNRNVEEKFNFKLVETTKHIDELASTMQTSILAGDNAYQAGFVGAHTISMLVGSNYLYDLYDIPELQLDEYWWDKSVINESKFAENSGLFFAATDLHLSAMDGTWCMMFNEDMAENLNIDKPYDLVRQGKWTIDKLQEYAKLGANLNGDDSFAWNESGNSIYGYTSFDAASAALIFSMGEKMIEKDATSQPYLALDTERFFSVTERIAQLNATTGEYYTANEEEPSLNAYGAIFKNERAFFIGCEIKMAQYLRDAEFTFGLVPFPKYNEEQEEYHSMMFYQLLLITIPITNGDTQRAGNIIDALSYEAKQQVMPIYYDVYISQKGLRNEDSIEMLDLINQTRILIGGYLRNFALLLGSKYFRYDTVEKYILFLEDHEKLSNIAKVSSFISHIEQTDFIYNVTGLVFGHYSTEVPIELLQRLERFGGKYNIPVVYCDDFGHGVNHGILPIGIRAVLDADNSVLRYIN